jgi:hypothetical protein
LGVGAPLDDEYAALGVLFESIRDPDGSPISRPVIIWQSDTHEIIGSPSWGPGADGRVAYEIRFDAPQRWAGIVRHWDNYYTITRFYDSSGTLIHTFEDLLPAPGWNKTFVGYLVTSDDPSQWISKIECDGKIAPPNDRGVGASDDLYFGTEDPLPSFALISPANGGTISSPPTFQWTSGSYDAFAFFSYFYYPGYGYYLYPPKGNPFLWLIDNSLPMPVTWWNKLASGQTHYWAVLGYNTSLQTWEVVGPWSFRKN